MFPGCVPYSDLRKRVTDAVRTNLSFPAIGTHEPETRSVARLLNSGAEFESLENNDQDVFTGVKQAGLKSLHFFLNNTSIS